MRVEFGWEAGSLANNRGVHAGRQIVSFLTFVTLATFTDFANVTALMNAGLQTPVDFLWRIDFFTGIDVLLAEIAELGFNTANPMPVPGISTGALILLCQIRSGRWRRSWMM